MNPRPAAPRDPLRVAAERRGRRAETLAALALMARGYRILARGWRPTGRIPGVGEIDIIARRGRLVAFVEVKARGLDAAAATAISREQQARIAKAAGHFMQHHPKLADCDWRFDAVLVGRWRWPRHLSDAWRP